MTNPYAATYLTAFNYFGESVKKNANIDINFGSELEIAFKSFYKFISEEVENNYFLKNNSKHMVGYIKNILQDNRKEIIIESHDSRSNMVYYKLIPKNFDLIIMVPGKSIKRRITKKYLEVSELEMDYSKMARSIRANWVHYTDALLLRDINRLSNKTFLTIHDCFIVDFLSVSNFIETANKAINIKIFQDLK
jgi:hypothetical protein